MCMHDTVDCKHWDAQGNDLYKRNENMNAYCQQLNHCAKESKAKE